MKRLLPFAFCIACSPWAGADDDYSDIVFTGTTFMYWCTYHEIPKSVDDFAKVTNVKDKDPRITLDPNEWIKSVRFEIDDQNLKIIKTVEVKNDGRVQTRQTSTATSNCDSFNPPLK